MRKNRKTLLITMNNSIVDLHIKGEITKNYFNPGRIFDHVIFLTFKNEEIFDEIISNSVANVSYEYVNIFIPNHFFIKSLFWRKFILLKWARSELNKVPRVELVRSYGTHINSFFGAVVSDVQKIPHLLSMHTNPKDNYWRLFERIPFTLPQIINETFLIGIHKYSISNSTKVICVYNFITEYVGKWNKNYLVVYNDIKKNTRVKKSFDSVTKCVLVGRLVEGKNPIKIIKALKHDASIHLDIIGDGPLRPKISKLIYELGISDRCKLIGSLPNSEIRECLQMYDLGFSTSDAGGISKVVLEYMASCVPVIINFNPRNNPPELIGDSCIVVSDSELGWYEGITILRNSSDHGEYLAREAYKKFIQSNSNNGEIELAKIAKSLVLVS
jgi:glycosyltransferase involved in cell wall biosynthesis